ncbi:MAG: sensor histidine kinase [Spirochaetales bacterium]|nr:sensor histidine kinase [Spirochaetales bacterium]
MRARRRIISANMHIKTLLSISIAIVSTFSVLTIGFLISFFFVRTTRESAIFSTGEIVNQVNNNLNYYISDIMNVADYARNTARNTGDLPLESIVDKLSTIIDSRNDLNNITLFDLDGNLLVTTAQEYSADSNDIQEMEWFKRAVENEGNFFFSAPQPQRLFREQEQWVISYSSVINYRTSSMESSEKAVLLINLNSNTVSEIVERASLPGGGYVYFISNDGDIVYHPMQDEINAGLFVEDIEGVQEQVYGTVIKTFNSRERLMIIDPVNQTSWRVVGITYVDNLMASLKEFQIIIGIVFLASAIVTAVISSITVSYITGPIRKLEMIMRKVQKGNFDIIVPMEGTKETQSLSASFSVMVVKIKKLMQDIKKTEALKRQKELDALQAKINPHFLYNTLDTMIWMAETGDKDGVVQMASSLASLFRISIAKGHDIITIEEEIEHVKNYLDIQSMRYKDKFSYETYIPENIALCPTIKLIIQPIVENSIYHGIKYMLDPGLISIKVREKDENSIEIIVSDNGIGMSQEKASSLLDPTYEKEINPDSNGNGIGLLNIDERIKLSYGSQYGLSIKSEIEEGTTVTITIPKLDPIKAVVIKKRLPSV